MKLRTNDTVLVIKGRDRGKQGQVQRIFKDESKILVEGVNVVKRHTKSGASLRQAGIIQKELPVSASNVMLICTSCGKPTRIKLRKLADDTKARICRNCEEVIE